MPRPVSEYVVYRGEEVVAVGTAAECAKKLGVKKAAIQCAATPSKTASANAKPDSQQLVAVRV